MNDLLRMRYFGQFIQSILLNTNHYSPQSIESSGSKYLILITTLIPGQKPKITRMDLRRWMY